MGSFEGAWTCCTQSQDHWFSSTSGAFQAPWHAETIRLSTDVFSWLYSNLINAKLHMKDLNWPTTPLRGGWEKRLWCATSWVHCVRRKYKNTKFSVPCFQRGSLASRTAWPISREFYRRSCVWAKQVRFRQLLQSQKLKAKKFSQYLSRYFTLMYFPCQ